MGNPVSQPVGATTILTQGGDSLPNVSSHLVNEKKHSNRLTFQSIKHLDTIQTRLRSKRFFLYQTDFVTPPSTRRLCPVM
ncbi:MAG: hypothetical protein ACI85E_001841 [Marinomonas primoryensis]|jgi:hypothetical protein